MGQDDTKHNPVSYTHLEFGGDHEEVVVKNLCRAVEIMVPQGE